MEWIQGSPLPLIWGRFYNASSQPESNAFQVDVGDPGMAYGGTSLAADAEGDFQAAWASQSTNYSSTEILTQRLQLNQMPVNTASIPAVNVLEKPRRPRSTWPVISAMSTFRTARLPTALREFEFLLVTPSISGSNLTLTYTSDDNGSADLTITATDTTGFTASTSVPVAVQFVNQAPSFIKGADETIVNNGQPQTFAGWATDVSAGPPDESGQVLFFNATADNPALFSAPPAVDPVTGNLAGSLGAERRMTKTAYVTLRDNGGTANGGVDTSAPQTFDITILPGLTAIISGPATGTVGTAYTLNLATFGSNREP